LEQGKCPPITTTETGRQIVEILPTPTKGQVLARAKKNPRIAIALAGLGQLNLDELSPDEYQEASAAAVEILQQRQRDGRRKR
jgi:hypothetical protein